jgi:uncharacterized damage-inducible protein DinB
MTVEEVMKHQLLSERRFFGEFLGTHEPEPSEILPQAASPEEYAAQLRSLAEPRLAFFSAQTEAWWLTKTRFFDVQRERIWIFWRPVLRTAHHRTQLTVYLRLLGKPVPQPTAQQRRFPGKGPTRPLRWKSPAGGRHPHPGHLAYSVDNSACLSTSWVAFSERSGG